MPSFQGSGFLIGLPEGCTDASAYTFLMSTKGQYTPYITIKSERLQQPQDLKAYVNKQQVSLQEHVEGFEVVQYAAGKRSGMDVVLSTVEWGPEEGRIFQKIAYFLMQDEKGYKIFTLTGNDLASQVQETGPMFERIFKTFTPNQIQLIEA